MSEPTCSCCGQLAARDSMALQCHPEVAICFTCVDWLDTKRRKALAAAGGPFISSVSPVFPVRSVELALDHFTRLGFTAAYHDESYAFALRDALTVHIALVDTSGSGNGGVGAIYRHIDDADQLADDWRKAGVHIDGPLDSDHGKREGAHLDPDGNLIRFGSPLRRPTAG